MFYGFQDGQSRDRNGQPRYGPRIAFATWHRNRYLLNSGCCHIPMIYSVILQKWQSLSGADGMESIMPLFYRSATIGRSYRKRLHAEIAQIDLNTSADASRTKAFSKGVRGRPPSTPTAIHRSEYSHVQQVSAHLKG